MKVATLLGMAAATLGAGLPVMATTHGEYTIDFARGYRRGRGYNLTREQARRVRQQARLDAKASPPISAESKA